MDDSAQMMIILRSDFACLPDLGSTHDKLVMDPPPKPAKNRAAMSLGRVSLHRRHFAAARTM